MSLRRYNWSSRNDLKEIRERRLLYGATLLFLSGVIGPVAYELSREEESLRSSGLDEVVEPGFYTHLDDPLGLGRHELIGEDLVLAKK
tara:strand:+ start:246 stop:509 length:264 start_codon:yes stop_codon:yes gene_type:complete